ncbi:MAG TPA: NADH-quinone oxidoreductase subunit N, partial [Pirellulales bacterium]
MSSETLYYLVPETILSLTAVVIYVLGASFRNREVWSAVAALGFVGATAALIYGPGTADAVGPVTADFLSQYGRFLSIVVGFLFLLTSAKSADHDQTPEFFGTLLLLVTGMMIASSARDLILLFIGLELITIPTYVLLYLARPVRTYDVLTEESTAKYFFLSVFAAAMLLYGLSFLYGATGETNLAAIYAKLDGHMAPGSRELLFIQISMLFIFAGLGFKITAVPFHFYAPDVYQGTSHAMAAVMSVAPKIAGVIALVRIIAVAIPGGEFYAWRMAAGLALVTMTVGNIMALWQDNVRRLMAFSSVANSGYLLLGLSVALAAHSDPGVKLEEAGFQPLAGTFLYLAVYAIGTIGVFAAFSYLTEDGEQVNTVAQLSGLYKSHPVAALSAAICLFSLAGIPPLAGFWGKFGVFMSALEIRGTNDLGMVVQNWSLILVIVGALNAAIAASYYLRLISVMYFGEPQKTSRPHGGEGALWTAVVSAALVLVVGCYPWRLMSASKLAGEQAQLAVVKPAEAAP